MRKKSFIAYLKELITPIQKLHYTWNKKRLDDWYKINHNGQVCKLRKVLNDKLDPSERRIYIGDGNSFARKYIYTRAEKRPVYLGKMFIYEKSEYISTGVDFIVFAPNNIVNERIHELKALLEFYKLASTRYQIRPI
ncbi:hypothetical protein [Flavobacterium sp.]|uniref:hypothetical protein n=1 Tax=Flavobacterium sp. TaxID=239 RepID=UPI003264E713